MKFEPSLQLKVQTTPGNLDSFATKTMTCPSTDEAIQEHLQSLQALVQDEIIEADKVKKENPKLHYNSDQSPINLPAIVGCLNWIALRTRPDIAWATSRAASLITHDPDTCFIRVKHIYIIPWVMRWDMFQFLYSPSTNCGYWEMPPLHQQGRRVNKVLLFIMVSPPINEKVVTMFNGDPADKIWLPSPLVKQNWLHQVKLFNKERASRSWFQRWSMRVVTLRYLVIMPLHSIWSGMDQRQHGEPVTSASEHYGCIRCPGEESSSHTNLLLRWQPIA